jgi:hypothetical protein
MKIFKLDAYSTGLLLVLISAPISLIVEDISSIDSTPSILYTISLFILVGFFFKNRVVVPIPFIVLLSVFFYALIISFILEVNIKYFIELCYILIFFYTFYFNRDININKIVSYAYFVGIVYLLYVLLSKYYIDSSINYLRFTYFLPVVTIFSIVSICNQKKVLVSFLALLLAFYLLMQYQGRYPIVFAFLTILIYPLVRSKHKGVLLALILAFFTLYFNDIIELISGMGWYQRLMYLEDGISGARSFIYTAYISHFSEFYLTGYGVGNTAREIYGIEGYYPHNLFAHAISELGIFGIFLSLMLVFQIVVSCRLYLKLRKILLKTNDKSNLVVIDSIFLIFVYIFFLFNKSGSFYDIYPLIVIITILKQGSISMLKKKFKSDDEYRYS